MTGINLIIKVIIISKLAEYKLKSLPLPCSISDELTILGKESFLLTAIPCFYLCYYDYLTAQGNRKLRNIGSV